MAINSWFDTLSEQYADRVAIHTRDGQDITFGRLSVAADQIATVLRQNGVGPGHTVMSTIDHMAINIAFWFAVWRIGGTVISGKLPASLGHTSLKVDAILTEDADTPIGDAIVVPFTPDILSTPVAPVPRQPEGAVLFPTVNSTRHFRVLGASARQLLQDAARYTDLLGPPPGTIFTSMGLDSMRTFRDVFRAFSHGVAVIGPDMPLDAYWGAIQKHRVRELFLTTLMLHRLLHSPHRPMSTPAITRVFLGSGTPQTDLLKLAQSAFGPIIDLAAGTPETSVYAFKRYDPATHEYGQIGQIVNRIIPSIENEDGVPLRPGQVGRLRLQIPRPQRLDGYIGGPSAYDGAGGAYPGFLASIDANGQVTKHGRTDDRLSLGGTRYFSGMIEDTLEKLPQVARACALRVFGTDGAEALGLVIEPSIGFSAEDIQTRVKRSLAGIGEVIVRPCDDAELFHDGDLDREAIARWWDDQPTG